MCTAKQNYKLKRNNILLINTAIEYIKCKKGFFSNFMISKQVTLTKKTPNN